MQITNAFRFTTPLSLSGLIIALALTAGCKQDNDAQEDAAEPTAAPTMARRDASPAPRATGRPSPTPRADAATPAPSPQAAQQRPARETPSKFERSAPQIDVGEVTRLAEEHNLPVPPDLDVFPPELARLVADAIRAAADDSSASNLGHLGMVYHVLTRHRSDTDRAVECYKRAYKLDPQDYRWPYLLGRIYLQRHSYEPARLQLEKALSLNPDYTITLVRLGEAAVGQRNADMARDYYDRYLEREPESSLGYLGLASAALLDDDAKAASTYIQKALDRQPNDGHAHALLADVHEQHDRTELAEAERAAADSLPDIVGAFEHDPLEFELWKKLGATELALAKIGSLLRSGDRPSARKLLEWLIGVYPEDPRILRSMSILKLQDGDLEAATEYARKAFRIAPHRVPSLVQLADCLMPAGQYQELLKAADRTIAENEDAAVPYTIKARALAVLNRLDESESVMQKAAALDPEDRQVLHALTELCLKQAKIDESRKWCSKAMDIDPDPANLGRDQAQSHLLMARIEQREDNKEAALQQLQKAAAASRGHLPVMRTVAAQSLALDDGKTAERILSVLCQRNPQDAGYHLLLAELLIQLNRPDEAATLLERAIPTVQNSTRLSVTLARIFRSQQQDEKAATILEKNPYTVDAYILLSVIRIEQDKAGEAIALARRGLEYRPNSPALKNLLAWILATTPDEALRQPDEAIQLAELICENTQHSNAGYLDTLAAAYAAAGRFEDAVKTEKEAIALGEQQPGLVDVEELNARLELFESGQPYTE